jgi:hypothetical protein
MEGTKRRIAGSNGKRRGQRENEKDAKRLVMDWVKVKGVIPCMVSYAGWSASAAEARNVATSLWMEVKPSSLRAPWWRLKE